MTAVVRPDHAKVTLEQLTNATARCRRESTSISPSRRTSSWCWRPSAAASRPTLRMVAGLEEVPPAPSGSATRGERSGAEGPRHRHGFRPALYLVTSTTPRARPAQPAGRRGDVARGRARRRHPRHRRSARAQAAGNCPAASTAARSGAASCAIRKCFCSTSRCRTSTPAAPRNAHRAQAAARAGRHHVDLRDARPGRGETLGDRVVVMRDGRIQQVGTPLTIYNQPRTASSPDSSARGR